MANNTPSPAFVHVKFYVFSSSARPTPAVSTFRDFESDDDDDFQPSKNTSADGGGGGGNNSRARMLAQQREIQMKKRQSSVTTGGKGMKWILWFISLLDLPYFFSSSVLPSFLPQFLLAVIVVVVLGMVRSSIDSTASASPMRKSGDNQFTPAIRQFSAPKALRSEYVHSNLIVSSFVCRMLFLLILNAILHIIFPKKSMPCSASLTCPMRYYCTL